MFSGRWLCSLGCGSSRERGLFAGALVTWGAHRSAGILLSTRDGAQGPTSHLRDSHFPQNKMPLVQMEPGAVGELRPPLHPTVWPGAALAPGGAQTLLVGDR